MNSYATDPIKEKSRQMIYRFANRHLPRDRSQTNALYLASDNDRESSYLDRLGIPRSRRIILEQDKSRIAAVKASNPGILVLPCTTHDFLKNEAEKYDPFWYVGFDYESMLGDENLGDIRLLADAHLADGGVLYTNFVGNREQGSKQEDYMEHFCFSLPDDPVFSRRIFGPNYNLDEQMQKKIASLNFSGRDPRNIDMESLVVELERSLVHTIPPENLDALRGYAITLAIQKHLLNQHGDMVFVDYAVPGIDAIITRCCGKRPMLPAKDARVMGGIPGVKFSSLFDSLRKIWNSADTGNGYMRKLVEKEAIRYFKRGGMVLVPYLFSELLTRGYVVEDFEPYSYTSSRNTRMMLDCMRVREVGSDAVTTLNEMIEKDACILYDAGRPYISTCDRAKRIPGSELIKLLPADTRRFVGIIDGNIGHFRYFDPEYNGLFSKTRQDLGSSFKQPLTVAIARKCVLDGMTNEEIDERYQVRDWRRIAAVRANVTRGNVRKPEQKQHKEKPHGYVADEYPKHLLPRDVYKLLPLEHRMRVDYFLDDVYAYLPGRKKATIRRAFHESNLRNMIDPSIDPLRFYAFFDDVQIAIAENQRITPVFIENAYRNAANNCLVSTVSIPVCEPENHQQKIEPSDSIKAEVRDLISSGIPKDEVWEAYRDRFSSRSQFGAVIAWASGKLADRRKNQ